MTDQPMTIDELLAWAREIVESGIKHDSRPRLDRVAQAIVNHLGVGHPCGWPKPGMMACSDGTILIEWSPLEDDLDIEEARGLFTSGLRACDEAERAAR
ncbi:MAG: hypothetical protein ACTHU0_22110 [Kofleriaceae bacterium]